MVLQDTHTGITKDSFKINFIAFTNAYNFLPVYTEEAIWIV